MIIKDKQVEVYDLEVFPNVFSCTMKNTETGEINQWEVSNRKNDIELILNKFKESDKLFCGFNCIHYDNVIINFLLEYQNSILKSGYQRITKNLYGLSNTIINGDLEKWKRWKYANNFKTLDLLTMLYSSKLRVGLKEMQVTMQYPNVEEYSGDFNQPLPDSEINDMLSYNLNDVLSTEALLYKCKDAIELRLSIENEYNIDALSKDGMTLGMEIIKHKYLEATHQQWYQIKDLRSPCDEMNLQDIIFPFIHYDSPQLQGILEEIKGMTVGAGRKSLEKHFLFDNLEYSIGVGGMHSVNTPMAFICNDDEIISDVDVASLYPSLIISYKLYPPHLGEEFLNVYSRIRTERLEAKHNGDKLKNLTLKLSLNGLTGNLQNEYSWVYSPETVMKIRMNGQFMLLMLAEKLVEAGIKIIQANTDGLFVLRKKKDEEQFKAICKWWENETKLTLEEDRFERFYQYAINDYLGVLEGYKNSHDSKLLKKKGLFIDTVTLGKGMQPTIIPKAINAYFAEGIPIADTIKASNDINDFITYQKIGKQFSVEYGGKRITHINRYYCSSRGYYLEKIDDKGKRIKVISDSGVKIVNDLTKIKDFPKDINYWYYIKEANKIIEPFIHRQLNLFD